MQKEDHDKAFMKEIFNCGYVIYDITEYDDQIDEVLWVLQGKKIYFTFMRSSTEKGT